MTQEDPYVCFGRKERVMVTLWEKFGEPPNLVDANWWFGGMRSAHEEGDSQPRGASTGGPDAITFIHHAEEFTRNDWMKMLAKATEWIRYKEEQQHEPE